MNLGVFWFQHLDPPPWEHLVDTVDASAISLVVVASPSVVSRLECQRRRKVKSQGCSGSFSELSAASPFGIHLGAHLTFIWESFSYFVVPLARNKTIFEIC